jgi:hypothetical protein
MEHDPWGWLSYRSMADLVLWAILIAVLLLYLWALASGPVAAVDRAPGRVAPAKAVLPLPRPTEPRPDGPAMV